MREYVKFYIDGQWVDPVELKTLDVINPANEGVCGKIALGSAKDVDKAVAAAKKAFKTWSQTTREERLDVLNRILAEYQKRFGARRPGARSPGRPWSRGTRGSRSRPTRARCRSSCSHRRGPSCRRHRR